MNAVLETIKQRRSIRSYEDRQIPSEELGVILEAARFAPSGKNQQAAKFVVVQSDAMRKKIEETCVKALGLEKSPFYGAPTFAFVFEGPTALTPVLDGAVAIENMMLAAASIGIGSCWIHASSRFFASPEGKLLQKELGVPESFECIDGCVLGYAKGERPNAAPRAENSVLLR